MTDSWGTKKEEYEKEEKNLFRLLNLAAKEGGLPEQDYYDIRRQLLTKTVPYSSWSFFTGMLGSLNNAYLFASGIESLEAFRKEVANVYCEYFKEYVYGDLVEAGHPEAAQLLYQNRWLEAAKALGTIDTTAKYLYRHELLSQGAINAPHIDFDEIEKKVLKGELVRA